MKFDNPGRPGQPVERYRHQPDVDIYFIGDALVTRKADGSVETPIITVLGRKPMRMPQIGERMTVPENQAKIIEQQTRTRDRAGNEVPGITRDAEYAKLKKASFEQNRPLATVVAEYASSNLSDEAVLNLAIARGLIKADAAPDPKYQDGKEKKSDPTPGGEIKYQDDVDSEGHPVPDGDRDEEDAKYQDDVKPDGSQVVGKPEKSSKEKGAK